MTDTLNRNPTDSAASSGHTGSPHSSSPVRVADDLFRKLRVVAFHRRLSLVELIDPVLRPWTEAEYREVLRQMNETVGGSAASEG